MDRAARQRDFRPARWALALLAVMALCLGSGTVTASATAPSPPPPTTPNAESVPASTLNVFMPEQENLTTCQSLAVQRPNCGSKARGGWRQTLVFAVIATGLVLIGIRLYFSVRRRDRALNT